MILGNANLDDYLYEKDVAYIQKIIGTDYSYSKEYFCDANYDGVIDEKNVSYVNSIIAGDWTPKILLLPRR